MVHFQPLFGPFWVQKSSWSLILSSLPYFNILHYPNVTLSCKGGDTYLFAYFVSELRRRCETEVEHGAMSTLLLRLELQYSVCTSVRTYKSLNLKKFLSLFVDIAYLTLFLPGERHATPFVTHGHIPH